MGVVLRAILACLFLLSGLPSVAAGSSPEAARTTPANLLRYVDPFLGTGHGGPDYGIGNDGGHVFPGAGYPQGMVQWSPDTTTAAGGYRYYQSAITGFSLTHFSGRGCSSYGDVPFIPAAAPPTTSPGIDWPAHASRFSHSEERATPGYYSLRLSSTGVRVELTVTPRTGFARFVYRPSTSAAMLINTGGSATGNAGSGTGVQIVGRDEVSGSASSGHFCGAANTYTVYFVARFDRRFAGFGTWNGAHLDPGSRESSGSASGAYVAFDTTRNQSVQVKVGLSFVGVANARGNLDRESPGWDFERVHRRARLAWNRELNRIRVGGGTGTDRTILYTALYHTLFHPNVFSDVNGQYIGFDRHVHTARGYVQYENFPGWDMYRSQLPLLAFLMPDRVSDMMQSLIADAHQGGGGLPRWQVANDNSGGMVGDSGDALIASAFAFGARRFDAQAALRAMDAGASDPRIVSGRYPVRPGLRDELQRGYIPAEASDVWGPSATTLEYAIDDHCIAEFARALHRQDLYRRYRRRAGNWRNVFDPRTGYMEPRSRTGAFLPDGPSSQRGFVEGDSAQYTWMVPQDLSGLFQAMGGRARAVERLNEHFQQLNAGPSSPYAFMGNEPEFAVPWEYDFAGAPYRTQRIVRSIETELFHATPDGLAGNDDGGAMSSWYVWSAVGLYPEVPGVAGFALGSPLFPSIVLQLPGGNELRITAPGARDSTPYVHRLRVNNRVYRQAWLPFARIRRGGTLAFDLGQAPDRRWGSR